MPYLTEDEQNAWMEWDHQADKSKTVALVAGALLALVILVAILAFTGLRDRGAPDNLNTECKQTDPCWEIVNP